MVGARTVTAAAGLAASLALSALLWWYFNTFVFFLVVPFVPLLFRRGGEERRPPAGECPECGFRTRDPGYEFCPRDGARLERERRDAGGER